MTERMQYLEEDRQEKEEKLAALEVLYCHKFTESLSLLSHQNDIAVLRQRNSKLEEENWEQLRLSTINDNQSPLRQSADAHTSEGKENNPEEAGTSLEERKTAPKIRPLSPGRVVCQPPKGKDFLEELKKHEKEVIKLLESNKKAYGKLQLLQKDEEPNTKDHSTSFPDRHIDLENQGSIRSRNYTPAIDSALDTQSRAVCELTKSEKMKSSLPEKSKRITHGVRCGVLLPNYARTCPTDSSQLQPKTTSSHPTPTPPPGFVTKEVQNVRLIQREMYDHRHHSDSLRTDLQGIKRTKNANSMCHDVVGHPSKKQIVLSKVQCCDSPTERKENSTCHPGACRCTLM